MSLKSTLANLLHGSAAHTIATAGGTALTQAVVTAAQKGNPIGDAALASAAALEATDKTGAEKKAAVIAAIVPVIAQVAQKNGVQTLEAEAVQFAGLVVEEVVAGMKATPLVQLAETLLAAFGVRV